MARSGAAFVVGVGTGVALCAALALGLQQAGWRLAPPGSALETPVAPAPAMDPEVRRKAVQAAMALAQDAVTAADWPTALREGEKALALEPTLPDAHKLLGLAYWRSGEACRGRGHFEHFVRLAPSDAWAARVVKLMEQKELAACATPGTGGP
jgi:hypothetical protein